MADTERAPQLDLALSAWFMMYLHDEPRGRPGGLPNDFLSHGAAALLLFDHLLCDQEAFDSECAFRNIWLSSDLLHQLKASDLLRTVDMRASLSPTVLEELRRTGVHDELMTAMERERTRILQDHVRGRDLALLPAVTELNHYLFAKLDLPRCVRYEWQESHFRTSPSAPARRPRTTAAGAPAEALQTEQQLVSSLLKLVLPDFHLLPPVPKGSQAAKALKRNVQEERPTLYRWIYGDPEMPQERYQELRRGSVFLEGDRIIDAERRPIAFQNLELLMNVRERTTDVRSGVQKIFKDVLDGTRQPSDVAKELAIHKQEIEAAFPESARAARWGLLKTSGGFIADSLLKVARLFVGDPSSPLGIPGTARRGTRVIQRLRRERERVASRSAKPLAWLVRDFEEEADQRRQKAIPRKYR
jgi:hypothetical protein